MCYVDLVRTPENALPVLGSLSSVVKQRLGVRFSASGVRLSLSSDRKDLHTSYFNLDEANLTLPGTERAELIRRDHPL